MTTTKEQKNLEDILRPFGRLGTDVATQILENLHRCFGVDHPSFIPDETGRYDTHKAAIRDGQRQVYLHIKKAIALSTHEPKKPKKAKTE